MSACDLVAPAFIHDELCCNHIQAVTTHVTSSWILQDLSDNKDKANTTSNTAQGQLTNSFHLRISQKNNMSTTIILLIQRMNVRLVLRTYSHSIFWSNVGGVQRGMSLTKAVLQIMPQNQ